MAQLDVPLNLEEILENLGVGQNFHELSDTNIIFNHGKRFFQARETDL